MKKCTILLAILMMATSWANAQSHVTLEHHVLGNYLVYLEDIMEMRNGNIVAPARLFTINGQDVNDYAYCFLKLSREDATIIDSTIVEADYTNFNLLEPNPFGEGYLLINEEYDFDCECSHMKIRRFDENFAFFEDQQTILPFEDTLYGGMTLYVSEGKDFIMCYSKSGNLILARYGIDGTLKDKTIHSDSTTCPIKACAKGLKRWNDSPREYAVWGEVYEEVGIPTGYLCVFDSLLQIKETVRIDFLMQQNVWFSFGSLNFASLDDDTYLMSSGYFRWNGFSNVDGIHVTKRDKTSHETLKIIGFEYPIQNCSPYVIDVVKNNEGDVFVAYGDMEGKNKLRVVKMDVDLNIIWQRYCISLHAWENSIKMRLLNDGGLAIPIFDPSYPGNVSVLIVNDDDDGIWEQGGISIRPYTYWPNPVQNELHLEYSPDVMPKQIELYDLQGRLVLLQTNGLECLNVECLPAGTYMMRVMLENGKVFSDKVLKE